MFTPSNIYCTVDPVIDVISTAVPAVALAEVVANFNVLLSVAMAKYNRSVCKPPITLAVA